MPDVPPQSFPQMIVTELDAISESQAISLALIADEVGRLKACHGKIGEVGNCLHLTHLVQGLFELQAAHRVLSPLLGR